MLRNKINYGETPSSWPTFSVMVLKKAVDYLDGCSNRAELLNPTKTLVWKLPP